MNPHNLPQTSVLALLVALVAACGPEPSSVDPERDESFLALMQSDAKADGLHVTEDSDDALAVLDIVNTYTFARLEADVGLDRRATAHIVGYRDANPQSHDDDNAIDTLRELDEIPWTGMRLFTALLHHARERCLDRCYTTAGLELPLQGDVNFDVADDGSWWVRAHAGGATVREARGADTLAEIDTSTFGTDDIDHWVVHLPDGSLTAVTRAGSTVVPEFGLPIELPALNHAVAAAYSADGDLVVAAEARDMAGAPLGLSIVRQGEDGWREELKHSFDGARSAEDGLSMSFTRSGEGHLQLWVDLDGAARRYDRAPDGSWRESMVLDMVEAGFGDHASARDVAFQQAEDGTVFVHRATWQFARRHELVRIDGNMMTAVIDLPVAARHVLAHPDRAFSVVYADGSVGHWRNGVEARTAPLVDPLDGTEQIRASGDDIYVLRAESLTILAAR